MIMRPHDGRGFRRLNVGLGAFVLLGAIAASAHAADACSPAFAHLVSVQGSVDVRRGGPTWAPVGLGAPLCVGDSVRVGAHGRAALLLSNQTTLRLDQNTTVNFVGNDARTTWLEQLGGGLRIITRTPRAFGVRTPYVNANVEGTEFSVRVLASSAQVTVHEGTVAVSNEFGAEKLVSGESATALQGAAPRRDFVVTSAESAAWALYFPTVFDPAVERIADAADPAIQRSLELYRAGRPSEAFDALGPSAGVGPLLVYRAALLLLVGRLDEARPLLARAVEDGVSAADALALLAVSALTENQGAQALAYAQRAVASDATSASALLASSYVEQSRFDLDAALHSTERALALRPRSALAMARRAELQMSLGRLDEALSSAREAVRLDPQLAKTHTVNGFADLIRIDTKAARLSFARAIELDQADPLPRLGLGLAKIRDGELVAGREEIEIATILDPLRSLIRSYLGKAYFDERRGRLAATQFALAKALDPNDPTPWFYDALREGADNRLIEAVDALYESIRLNDRRAVYRSRLLLDDDLAARSASLARNFLEVDLRETALALAATSLAVDPGSASAHRFLSDVNSGQSRHEITRTSELLQAQLRQPISVTPLPARLSNDRLFSSRSDGPNAAGFDEFGSLFLADGFGAQAHVVAGNRNTRGEQALLSGVRGPLGVGVSALQFRTDGNRPNADYDESGANAIAQLALSANTSIQAEVDTRHRKYGDIVSHFFAEAASTTDRLSDSLTDTRLGLRHSIDPASDVLVSLSHRGDRTTADFDGGLQIGTSNQTTRGEVQYLLRRPGWSVTGGVSYLRGNSHEDVFGDVFDSKPRHFNAYVYSTTALVTERLHLIAGGSFDHLQSHDSGDEKQFNPKVGLIWRPLSETTVRAAYFRALKRRINADSGLEPTQVAGFDQYFDDVNGTKSQGGGLAVDSRLLPPLRVGASFSGRQTNAPLTNADGSISFVGGREHEAGAYAHWTFGRSATLSSRLRYSRYERPLSAIGDEAFALAETTELPVTLKVFGPAGLWTSLVVTPVHQRGRFRNGDGDVVPGSERFTVADLAIGYRLTQRRGNLSFECTNLFNRDLRFQDIGVDGARYAPHRNCLVRLSVEV